MKKIICTLLLIQSGFIMAQTETVVTNNGKKVTINTNPLVTANNGLTATGGNVQLGGSLTKASALTTTSSFTLALLGLQQGDATNNLLVSDSNGVIKVLDPSLLATEPWYNIATNAQATANTQNIYQMGNVAIGKTTVQAGAALDVNGAIRGGNTSTTGAIGANSIAVGDGLVVSGSGSASFGLNNTVLSKSSMAVGDNLNISVKSDGSIVLGSQNTVSALNSFMMGYNNKLTNLGGPDRSAYSTIFGTNNQAVSDTNGSYQGITIFGRNNVFSALGSNATADANTIFGQNNQFTLSITNRLCNNNFITGGSNAITISNVNSIINCFIGGTNNKITDDLIPGNFTLKNLVVFGENNIANKANQFVIGSANENVANALFEIGNGTSATARANAVTVLQNGNVGIGTSAPGAYKLLVNGQAGGTGAWTQSSDRRYKKDITPITGALDKIMKIEGVGYNWKTEEFKDMHFDNKHQLGVIAQDIEKIIPDAVTKDDKGYYSVSYTTLVPVLVEAVKEQQKQIEELKALVKQLADKK